MTPNQINQVLKQAIPPARRQAMEQDGSLKPLLDRLTAQVMASIATAMQPEQSLIATSKPPYQDPTTATQIYEQRRRAATETALGQAIEELAEPGEGDDAPSQPQSLYDLTADQGLTQGSRAAR
jgi:uncharacterized protein YgbK (DUF1537 family)